MTTPNTSVQDTTQLTTLGNRILAALKAAGKDLEALTVDDLAPVDEFHIRGRAATEKLLQLVQVRPDHLLLDSVSRNSSPTPLRLSSYQRAASARSLLPGR